MSHFRELVADAALHLRNSRGASQEWLSMSRPENILARSALVRSLSLTAAVAAPVLGSAIRLDDQVIGYVGGESPVADAAQWLYLNRNVSSGWHGFRDTESILNIYRLASDYDKRRKGGDKKYSLSDLSRAYDAGHRQGVLDGEHMYSNQLRDAALKEI